jgi:decaprenyl-phosphate phosphoribosyltransferase
MALAVTEEESQTTDIASVPLRSTRGATLGLLRLLRPRQWVKNLLIFVAPGAGGVLQHRHALLMSTVAAMAFCLASSSTYALNDVFDVTADRMHPEKRLRPVASGTLSRSTATAASVALMAGACASAWGLVSSRFALVIAAYLALTVCYSVRLKHEPVIDIACVSSGFVLRAIGGGVAAGIPLSNWFLIVASFGALFIVTGKRSAEQASPRG